MPEGAVKPGVMLVRGQIPDLMNWRNSDLNVSLEDASPDYALAWLRLFSKRIPHDLSLGGTLSLTASRLPLTLHDSRWNVSLLCQCVLPDKKPSAGVGQPAQWHVRLAHTAVTGQPAESALAVLAYPQPQTASTSQTKTEGRIEPIVPVVPVVHAADSITGQISSAGYTLVYGSNAMATLAASLMPPLGDGMPTDDETTGALEARRAWNGPQTWTAAPTVIARKPGRLRGKL
jgi:hypothetical protein